MDMMRMKKAIQEMGMVSTVLLSQGPILNSNYHQAKMKLNLTNSIAEETQ